MISMRTLAYRRPTAVLEPPPPVEAGDRETLRDESSRTPQPSPCLTRAGIFWSAEGSPGATDAFYGSGKYVAAASWAQALARHGSHCRVDIFAPLTSLERCHQHFQGLPAAAYGTETAVARLLPESQLPGQLQAQPYDLLHDATGLDLTRGSYLRARFSHRVFPLTCSQYGISYSFDLHATFIKLLTAQIYPCDAIVCSTGSSRQAMEQRLSEIAERYSRAWDRPAPLLPRLEQIPWGVDTERFAPRDSGTARREFDLPPDRPILLCMGRVRIQDKMDCTPLLLAFAEVSRRVKPRPLLVLAGGVDPGYGEQVRAHAAHLGIGDDVRTFFNLPSACLPALYAAGDVFVSPVDTPSESFGLTIIEAMACGRPVVASDWDGYKELIVHGETGFKVRTDWADCLGELDAMAPALAWDQQHLHVGQSVSVNVGQLAGYLTQLVENRELREAMGRRGRARVAALYDWPVVIQQWEALWAELAALANSLERQQEDRLDYLQPRYFEHFGHYASRIIDDDTPVRLTERGKEQLAGRGPFFLHAWNRGFLQPQHLQAALAALKPSGWLGTSLPVGKVVEALEKRHGLTRDRSVMHLMWLAKYDLIALEE
jgi:D-inositol-3-phosphate glycosyltransferase